MNTHLVTMEQKNAIEKHDKNLQSYPNDENRSKRREIDANRQEHKVTLANIRTYECDEGEARM